MTRLTLTAEATPMCESLTENCICGLLRQIAFQDIALDLHLHCCCYLRHSAKTTPFVFLAVAVFVNKLLICTTSSQSDFD